MLTALQLRAKRGSHEIAAMPGALVLQAVGLAALREAERAAASMRAVQPSLMRVVIGDAATLHRASDLFQLKIDVEDGLDASVTQALRRAANVETGCRRRVGCADAQVRALRIARMAYLRRLVPRYAFVVALDADSLACGPALGDAFKPPDNAMWDVALRPVPVAVRKGPARNMPPYPPEFSGALMVLRNTTKTRALLAEWAVLYARDQDGKHPTSDQPLLRAALRSTSTRVRYLPLGYGCAVWSAAAKECPAFTADVRRAVGPAAQKVRGDKLGGPNAALWRAHERALNRGACVMLHGLHG